MTANRPDHSEPPEECANCGASIPGGAKACPECGADERTGWRETDVYDGLDLPDESLEDEASGPGLSGHLDGKGTPWYWWCAGIALVAVLALGALALL